jgi:hypothetical protein
MTLKLVSTAMALIVLMMLSVNLLHVTMKSAVHATTMWLESIATKHLALQAMTV